MIRTESFKTRTTFIERVNVMEDGYWGVGVDIGYSGLKVFSPNSVSCIPAYARKMEGKSLGLGKPSDEEIQYRNNATGEVWYVGASAINMITSDDSKDSANSLFGRNRYFSPMFKVLSEVGIALGLMANEYGNPNGRKLMLTTGLPPAYIKSDTPLLKAALAGHHVFEMKVGDTPWKKFEYTLSEDNIFVIDQPMGTLLSISSNQNGKPIKEAAKYFNSKVMIFDPGFGTLDVFDIHNGTVISAETYDHLGMKKVMENTSRNIFNQFGVDIPVIALQKNLATGTVKCFNREKMTTKLESFADILETANRTVCNDAIDKIKNDYNNLIDTEYLVVTGGTGAAWYEQIKAHFAGMDGLVVVQGKQNDVLPYIFANVRGYYMYMLGKIRSMARASK